MEIEFISHRIQDVDEVFFAIDKSQNDVYVNAIRNYFHSSSTLRYIMKACNNHDNFIDIGSNIGLFTLPIAKAGIRTLAIEALPKNYILLAEAIKKNRFKNTVVIHAAVSDQPSTVHMTGTSAWAQMNTTGNGVEVPALTMDAIAEIYNFTEARIIKIDIEGAEMLALSGMENLLNNQDVEIIFESNAWTCGLFGYSIKALKQFLAAKGFKLYYFYEKKPGHSGKDTLVPSSPDDFQLGTVADYLATKKDIHHLHDFEVRALSPQEKTETFLSSLHISSHYQLYAFTCFDQAPLEIKNHESIKSLIEKFSFNMSNEERQIFETLKIGIS